MTGISPDLAFLPPHEYPGAGPFRSLTPEEIEAIAPTLQPTGRSRRSPLSFYWRESFMPPRRRKWAGREAKK